MEVSLKVAIILVFKQNMFKKKMKNKNVVFATGLSKSHISMILSGKRNPEIETLDKICLALKMSLADFFKEVETIRS
jgi:transcriptional regulator with XRE-family HTH domain